MHGKFPSIVVAAVLTPLLLASARAEEAAPPVKLAVFEFEMEDFQRRRGADRAERRRHQAAPDRHGGRAPAHRSIRALCAGRRRGGRGRGGQRAHAAQMRRLRRRHRRQTWR